MRLDGASARPDASLLLTAWTRTMLICLPIFACFDVCCASVCFSFLCAQLLSVFGHVEHEIDRVRQQNASDAVTLDFLAQQLQHMEAALEDERSRTAAAALEHAQKAEAEQRESTLRDTARQQQAEIHAQLRGQKRQLTKEVKTVQVELEQEKEARNAVQREYEQLVATLAALKATH